MPTQSGQTPGTAYTNFGGAVTNYPSGTALQFFSGASVTFDSGVTETHAGDTTWSATGGAVTFKGDVKIGNGTTDLPLAATAGFLFIPCSTGTPTGSIAVAGLGMIPIVYDRISKKLFVQPASGTWVSYSTA